MIDLWMVKEIRNLKREAWNALPETGSDPVALARFIAICDVCRILGIND